MEKIKKIGKQVNKTKRAIYTFLIRKIVFSLPIIRNQLLKQFEKKFHADLVENNKSFPKQVQEKKYEYIMAMLNSGLRNLDKGNISKKIAERILNTLVKFSFIQKELCKETR
ncbi:hypothetical protein DRJ22_01740, partial [Candidatus Woesearchaeota archaeon]